MIFNDSILLRHLSHTMTHIICNLDFSINNLLNIKRFFYAIFYAT